MKKEYALIIIGLAAICLYSCRQGKKMTASLKDHDLSLQLIKISGQNDGASTLNYAVRLIPAERQNNAALNTALWYQMDSCFYLLAGNKKIYASITQPIANGIKGTFEYFVSFPINNSTQNNLNLVYQDKYINHKKYFLNLMN